MWMRGGFCRTEGCQPKETHTYATAGGLRQGPGKKVFLDPGQYFLYLVADGAPVQVTLELGGLSGTRQIAPKVAARGEVRVPEVRFSGGPSRQAHWFGEEYVVKGEGVLTYSAMQVETNDWVAGEVGWCAYTGEPDPGPLAYSPACPSGFTYTVPIVRTPPSRVEVLDRTASHSDFGGRFGFGYHLLTTGAVERVDGIFFFLDFDRSDFR